MAGKIRNHTSMKSGGKSAPLHNVAFTEPDPQQRGKAGKTSRVSRIGSTARKTGSGVAGK